jgi:hypothetical protein
MATKVVADVPRIEVVGGYPGIPTSVLVDAARARTLAVVEGDK